jgi:hypothetical protein
MVLVPMLLAASLSTADTTVFVQRIAEAGYGSPPVVTMGALPPNWTAPVPLPQSAPLLGSVLRENQKSVELLYAPDDGSAVFSAYETALEQSGFAPLNSDVPGFATGGFVQQNPVRRDAMLCRGTQGVTVRLLPGNDLRVDIPSADAPGSFNSCNSSQLPAYGMQAISGILPSLRGPKGVVVTPNTMGGSSWGFGPSGSSANVTYGASFEGNTGVAELLNTFTTQLTNDGWSQNGSAQSETGAFAAFSRDFNGQHWKADLLVYPSEKPRLFQGLLVASGEPLVKPQPPLAPSAPRIPATLGQSDTPVVLELMRRIVDSGSTRFAAVFVRKTPPDLPRSMPLPQGMLLGSTVAVQDFDATANDTLYYNLTASELDAYQQALMRGGWKATPTIAPRTGFVSDADTEPIDFCKQDEPGLTVSARPDSSAVTIMVVRSHTLGGCHPVPMPPNQFPQLPKLVAPRAQANHLYTTNDSSASAFTSPQSPSALLDAFAGQMRAQGWRVVNRIANTFTGTETFVSTTGTGPKTTAITVTRSSARSQAYVASMIVY